MAAEQRPVAQSALTENATGAVWKTIPSWGIVTTRDLNIPAAAQRFMAERAHAHTTEVAASHSAAVSHPHLVVEHLQYAEAAWESNLAAGTTPWLFAGLNPARPIPSRYLHLKFRRLGLGGLVGSDRDQDSPVRLPAPQKNGPAVGVTVMSQPSSRSCLSSSAGSYGTFTIR